MLARTNALVSRSETGKMSAAPIIPVVSGRHPAVRSLTPFASLVLAVRRTVGCMRECLPRHLSQPIKRRVSLMSAVEKLCVTSFRTL